MFDPEHCSPAVTALIDAVEAVRSGGVPDAEIVIGADTKALLGLRRLFDSLVGERLRVCDSRDLPDLEGAATVASWGAQELCLSASETTFLLQVGTAAQKLNVTGEHFGRGEISARHVDVIRRSLRGLPEDKQTAGDRFLAEQALHTTPAELRVLGKRFRETVAPTLSDEETRDLQADQHLHASPTLGGVKVDGWLTGSNAEWFMKGLDRFSPPVPDDIRTSAQRRADGIALMARVAAGADLAARDLKDSGYTPADLPRATINVLTDVVTMQRAQDQLLDRASLPEWLPAAERELAGAAHGERTGAPLDWRSLLAGVCDGEVRRLVLAADSEVLDLGRTARFYSRAQRRALARGGRAVCAWPRCGSPWVEAHHRKRWVDGGMTDHADGILLCTYHHARFHDGWTIVEGGPDEHPRAVPPLDWAFRRSQSRRGRPRAA